MIPRARWQKIQSLFEESRRFRAGRGVARLASSCQGDSELRDSVEALLASDRRTEDPLINAIGCGGRVPSRRTTGPSARHSQ